MKTKRFKHKEIKWVSIKNIDIVNSYIRDGWQLKSIHYLDPDYPFGNKIVPSGCYSNSMRIRFIKER